MSGTKTRRSNPPSGAGKKGENDVARSKTASAGRSRPKAGKSGALSGALRRSFRDSLWRKREELLSLYRHDLEAGKSAADEGTEDLADQANKAYAQDLTFALSDAERAMVFQIDEALARLEDGTYGTCENCGTEIGLPRLEAVPWAHFCISCQERDEMGLLDG